MKRFLVLPFEVAYVVLCAYVAGPIAMRWNLIPQWILDSKRVDFTSEDVVRLLWIYGIAHLLVLGLVALASKVPFYASARRWVRELYAVIFAASGVSMFVFVMTHVNFSPNYFLVVFLLTLLGLLVSYAVSAGLRQGGGGALLPTALRSIRSPAYLAVILLAASPVGLAFWYKKDTRVANAINNIRLYFNSASDFDWALVDAFPGLVFDQPIAFDWKDGADCHVLERPGRIVRVRTAAGVSTRDVVLDFSARVGKVSVENGALGLALHPYHDDEGSPFHGRAFVYYTDVTGDVPRIRLSRWNLALPTAAERAASEVVLIEQTRDESGFHNAGCIGFGPEGFLYVSIGEATDSRNHQVIDRALFAGILRIDVDEVGGTTSHPIRRQPEDGQTANYFIPSDNPFVGKEGVLEEFFALGMRNPFRFSFDEETGELWASDNGGGRYEEVNQIEAGGNYQYPQFEGPVAGRPLPTESLVGVERTPFHAYAHTAYDRSVIGGVVYRGTRWPKLVGDYVFADGFSGHVFALRADGSEKESRILARSSFLGQIGIAAVGVSPGGDILFAVLGDNYSPSGHLLKLVRATDGGSAPSALDRPTFTRSEIPARFVDLCARCHGLKGGGDGEAAAGLAVHPKNFTAPEWQASVTDERIFAVIQKGGAALGLNEAMPSWGNALKPEEIRMMVDHVRSLGGRGTN